MTSALRESVAHTPIQVDNLVFTDKTPPVGFRCLVLHLQPVRPPKLQERIPEELLHLAPPSKHVHLLLVLVYTYTTCVYAYIRTSLFLFPGTGKPGRFHNEYSIVLSLQYMTASRPERPDDGGGCKYTHLTIYVHVGTYVTGHFHTTASFETVVT